MRQYFKTIVFFVCVFSTVSLAVVPSARPGIGATLYDGGATFRVWASNATTVSVAGEFSSWSQRLMASEGGGWWSRDVGGVIDNSTNISM